jgi:hypothetical protein
MTDSLNDQRLLLNFSASLLDCSNSWAEIHDNLRNYLASSKQSYESYFDFAGFAIDYPTVRSFYNFQAEFLACCYNQDDQDDNSLFDYLFSMI